MPFSCLCVLAFITVRAALDRAAVLLSMKREIMRLDNVWGVGGGQRPVKHLIKAVKSLSRMVLISAVNRFKCLIGLITHLLFD